MSDADQARAFHAELTALIYRFGMEFELSTAAAIGVLQMKQFELFEWSREQLEKEDE